MKKAISAATSAALLASLLATAVAPSAFAATTVGSAGNVPVGGTSANNVSFTFTEQAINSIATNASGSFTVTICDNAGVTVEATPNLSPVCTAPGRVTFSGTPSVVGSTGSLGASASLIAPNVLQVSIGGSDTANIESIFISGLKITASSTAAAGAISATMGAFAGSLAAGAGIFSGGNTATGYVTTNPVLSGNTSVIVTVVSTTCPFVVGTLNFVTSPESVAITAVTPATPVAPNYLQTLTIGAVSNNHFVNESVNETTACAAAPSLASPGTVVTALTYNTPNNPAVYPGENNSPAANLVLVEPSPGFLPASSTLTYTITTPGVVFSNVPTVSAATPVNEVQTVTVTNAATTTFMLTFGAYTTAAIPADGTETAAQVQTALQALASIGAGNVTVTGSAGGPFTVTFVGALAGTNVAQMTGTANVAVATTVGGTANSNAMVLSGPVLSASRTSVTVTVSTASAPAATITLSGILYDVASTVPAGTYVAVSVATSGALTVLPASNTNAVVFFGITASAPSPTVYIGENAQTAGIISFKESQAGMFTAGVGTGTNVFSICPTGVNFTFTVAPYAQVVGGMAAGNLVLRDGSAASTTNLVQGTVNGNCYTWYVWTASTTASTITIGGAGLTAGALINVTTAQAPGGVDAQLYDGNSNTTQSLFATVQFATAVYRNQVAVTALSQPYIAPGTTHGAAGNLQIAETGLGQLKANELICVEVLWKSGNLQDQFLNGLNTADLPVAMASGTGLVIGPVNSSDRSCAGNVVAGVPAGYMQSFSFPVYQQSTAGDGKVVISNISYTALTGGTLGPVQLSVWGLGGAPTNVIFHSTVSNAIVGTAPAAAAVTTAGSALGATKTGPFTVATKVAKLGTYVTWKFSGGSALVGQTVQIWVATKNSAGKWSAFKLVTARTVDSSGNAYFWWKTSSKAWISVRGGYLTSLSVATQARWL
jgi:hypothetical protein